MVNFDNVVVIDGLPTNVDPGKKQAFAGLFTRKLEQLLEIKASELKLKLLDDEQTGFVIGAFLDCKTSADADRAVARLNKVKFTKNDELRVYRWSDFEAVRYVSHEYEAPDADDETRLDLSNPQMMDKQARPQLLIKANENFHCHWFYLNTNSKLTHVRSPNDLLEWSLVDQRAKKVQEGLPTPLPMFSPLGTYVITHAPGYIRLYGGKGCNLVSEFSAQGVKLIQMSPNEKYLVLYTDQFTFWDIQSGKTVGAPIPGVATKETWPIFKYNADDSLVATFDRKRGTVVVFDAATMQLQVQEALAKWTIKEEGMSAFAWSPTDPETFAYAVPGDDNVGFRVMIETITLLEDKDEIQKNMCAIRQLTRRNYFQTKEIELLWHPMGTHLAAKITKTNDTITYGIFKMTPYGASSEALEVKGEPLRFAWQPNSDRFSIITASRDKLTTKQLSTVWFYEACKAGFQDVGSLKCSGARMFWAPKGNHCVIVNFETSRLEFFGVLGSGPFAAKGKMELINSTEHPMITNAEWDPTGRFLCSWTSTLKYQTDNSYMIWDVNGNKLHETKISRLSHCTWRPLAPSLLHEADLNELKKKFPAIVDSYNAEALAAQRKADDALAAKRKAALDKYIKSMNGIWDHIKANGFDKIRKELIAKSPSWKKNQEQIASAALVTAQVDEDDE